MRNDPSRLAATLAATDQPSLILSTEGLTNHLYDFFDDALAAFRDTLRGHEVRCLVMLRAPEAWLRSYYKQIIINPRVSIPGVWFYGSDITLDAFHATERAQALTDHARLCADIAAAYGAETMIVLQLEDDWMAEFDRTLGIDSRAYSPAPRENESAPDACIEIMRQVNAYALREAERIAWKAALQIFSGSNHTLLKAAQKQFAEMGKPNQIDHDILKSLRPDQQEAMPLSLDTLSAFADFVRSEFATGSRADLAAK